MKAVFDIYDKVLKILLCCATGGFVAICLLQVFFRFVLQNSLVWSQEACNLLFFLSIFLGAAVCVTERPAHHDRPGTGVPSFPCEAILVPSNLCHYVYFFCIYGVQWLQHGSHLCPSNHLYPEAELLSCLSVHSYHLYFDGY